MPAHVSVLNMLQLKHVDVFKLLVRLGCNDYTAAMYAATTVQNIPVIRYLGARHCAVYAPIYGRRCKQRSVHGHAYKSKIRAIGPIISKEAQINAAIKFVHADNVDMVTLLHWNMGRLLQFETYSRVIRMSRQISYSMTLVLNPDAHKLYHDGSDGLRYST